MESPKQVRQCSICKGPPYTDGQPFSGSLEAEGWRTVLRCRKATVKIIVDEHRASGAKEDGRVKPGHDERWGGDGGYEHPLVFPQVSHFMQVPFLTMVKLPHSPQLSPS